MPAEGSGGPRPRFLPFSGWEKQDERDLAAPPSVDEARLGGDHHRAAARISQGVRDRATAPVFARPDARNRADAHASHARQPRRRPAPKCPIPRSCVYDTSWPVHRSKAHDRRARKVLPAARRMDQAPRRRRGARDHLVGVRSGAARRRQVSTGYAFISTASRSSRRAGAT